MIEHLSGQIIANLPHGVVLSVGGVGYGVEMSEDGRSRLTPASGDHVAVWVHTHVREDQIKLFGFATYRERRLFQVLLTVSGIGPRLALNIVGSLSVDVIITAALQEEASPFEQVSGVGARLAKKLVVELKPKLEKEDEFKGWAIASVAGEKERPPPVGVELRKQIDLRSALENLGYSAREINQVLALGKLDWESSLEQLLPEALRFLRVGKPGEKRYADIDEKDLPF